MSKTPIKSNLFRFVTLRKPQQAEETDKAIGFVSFPENSTVESKVYTAAKNSATNAEKKQALETAFDAVNDIFTSRIQIQKKHTELYQFSSWLMRNKSSLSLKSIASNLSGATKLSNDDEIIIWDNLFYQITNKTSESIRERLLQLLVTNQFLEAFNALKASDESKTAFSKAEKEEFIRRAKASVIIPKDLLFSKPAEDTNNPFNLSTIAKKHLTATIKTSNAQKKLQSYKNALEEVQRAKIVHLKKEEKRYQEAQEKHISRIEKFKKNNPPVIKTITDPSTNLEREIKTYPGIEDISFTFNKAPEIIRNTQVTEARSGRSLSSDITTYSSATTGILNSRNLVMYDTFDELTEILKTNIRKEHQVIFNNTPKITKNIHIGGETIKINTSNVLPLYSYSLDVLSFGVKTPTIVGLSIHLKNFLVDAKHVSYSISDSTGKTIDTRSDFIISKLDTDNQNLALTLFPKGIVLSTKTYTIKGEITLINDTVLSFESTFPIVMSDTTLEGYDFGIATLESVSDTDTSSPTKVQTIYGVSQLGIADFRRVEQEICCYIPGEVSHIENIMAREYKERSTRNLNSYESTTEKTSEKEVENLTDTTSTERNELQSETSSIVNSDNTTNFGANASVSSEFGGTRLSAGANFNTSSSSSVSDSNLQAQTYAQEVTERALERVVQKVSTKRTSRILREHEENSSHGFDNTEGENHVSGVYRWVDKIYKNTLVNYGKRLMYEFAIPEPAKFFLATKTNRSNTTNENDFIAPIKPEHPENLGLSNSTGLDEENYQMIASVYNAEIPTFPEEEVELSKSFKINFKQTTGAGGQEGDSINDEIAIPKNYITEGYKVSGGYFSHGAGVAAGGKAIISIGSDTHYLTTTSFQKEFNITPKNAAAFKNLKIKEAIAVSASSWDIFTIHFNVNVKCIITEEGKQQWQNETYKAIMDAYNERLQEYNEFMQARSIEPIEDDRQKEFSTRLNRSIEKREIKRIAIDLLTAPYGIKTSQSNYTNESFTKVKKDPALERHSAVVKFFEQAFDWEIMAYTFYPYFYNDENHWNDPFDYTNVNDPIFKAFLLSAMARTVVPVRTGFEYAVTWFMNTGEIWGGQGMVTDTEDDLYVSIAEEIETIQGVVEGEPWETRVPTSLTLLQAESVALDEGGLPCNEDCSEHSVFSSSTNTLGGAKPDGIGTDIVGATNDIQ